MAPWRYANIQLLFFFFLSWRKDFFGGGGGKIAICCKDCASMAVKHIDDNMLLTLMKVEADYVIARRNIDLFSNYGCMDQDDTSVKSLYQSFKN